jgi:hypothetical protein
MDDRKINGLNDRKDCCVNAVGVWSPASLRAWTIGSVAVVDARSSLDASLPANFFLLAILLQPVRVAASGFAHRA